MGKPKKWVIVVFYAFFILSFAFFSWNAVNRVLDTFNYQKEQQAKQKQISELKASEQKLKEEKARLENPDYILKYARGKFLLSKDGEQIVRLPSKEK